MSDVNVFIIVNLGCEMLYVIDQRLRAQNISLDKSIQVLKDITGVLFDRTFLERLIIGSKQKTLLTVEHCKFILNDVACCSLMRLDDASMDKLWDLISMVFKWQLSIVQSSDQLLEITFRHLDGVSQLHPNTKKAMLIDSTKNLIGDFWSSRSEVQQQDIFTAIQSWFQPLVTKISILIRFGFQNMDGTFRDDLNRDVVGNFLQNIGENIYGKRIHATAEAETKDGILRPFKGLAEQLNIATTNEEIEICPSNLYFENSEKTTAAMSKDQSEFVQLKTVHRATSSWETVLGRKSLDRKDLQSLLNQKLT